MKKILRVKTNKRDFLKIGDMIFTKEPRFVNFDFLTKEKIEGIEGALFNQELSIVEKEVEKKDRYEISKERLFQNKDKNIKKLMVESVQVELDVEEKTEEDNFYIIYNGVRIYNKILALDILSKNEDEDESNVKVSLFGEEDSDIKKFLKERKDFKNSKGASERRKWPLLTLLSLLLLLGLLGYLLK